MTAVTAVDAAVWNPPDELWASLWALFYTSWMLGFLSAFLYTTFGYYALMQGVEVEQQHLIGKHKKKHQESLVRLRLLTLYKSATYLLATLTLAFFSARHWLVVATNDIHACRACQFVFLRMPLVFIGLHTMALLEVLRQHDQRQMTVHRLAMGKVKRSGGSGMSSLCCRHCGGCLCCLHLSLLLFFWGVVVLFMVIVTILAATGPWNQSELHHDYHDAYLVSLAIWTATALYSRLVASVRSFGNCAYTKQQPEWSRCRQFYDFLQLILIVMIGFMSYAHAARQIHREAEEQPEPCEDWTMQLSSLLHLYYFGNVAVSFYLFHRILELKAPHPPAPLSAVALAEISAEHKHAGANK